MRKRIITLLAVILCTASLFCSTNALKVLLYLLGVLIILINYRVNYSHLYMEDKDTIHDILHCICSEFNFDKFRTNNPSISEHRIRLVWILSVIYVSYIIGLLILSSILTIYYVIH